MGQKKVYLDDDGNPMKPVDVRPPSSAKVYLDDDGNEIAQGARTQTAPDGLQRFADSLERGVADLYTGAAKGAGESLTWLADTLVRPLPGMAAVERAVPPWTYNTATTSPAQTVGKAAERIGEVIAPGRAMATLGTKAAALVTPRLATATRAAVEGAGSAGLAAMQGGDATTAGALGAAVPVVGTAIRAAAPALRTQAATKVEQALGGSKERYKAMGRRLTPEILKRGLGGSREALLERAKVAVETTGDQIDEAIQQYGSRDVGTRPITDALESAKDAFRDVTKTGALVEFEPRAIRQLEGIQKIIGAYGPDMTVKQMIGVRRAWDKVVDQAGGYAHRAGGAIGVPLKDQSEAAVKREATSAIRAVLAAEVPELAALNKEFSFWKGLDDVLTQTQQRAAPQQGGLKKAVVEVAGAAAGASHGLGAAWATGKVAGLANQVFTSPRWRFVDARMRDQLASAIESGSQARISHTLGRIAAVQASQLPAGAR